MTAHADLDLSGVPFEHGFVATGVLERDGALPGLGVLAEALGDLSSAGSVRLAALQEPGDLESDLRRLGLLGFWDTPDTREQTLLLLRFEFQAEASSTFAIHSALSRMRTRAEAGVELDIVIPVPRLQARRASLERLASSVRLPHQIDRPLRVGEVYRLEADASLMVSLSASERLGVSVRHPGPAGATLERTVSIRGGLRANAKADARVRWDVRSGATPHRLALHIQETSAAEAGVDVSAEAVASLGSRGLPDRAVEIIASLLGDVTDDPEGTAEEIVDAMPDLVERVDDAIIRASRLRLKAALEAALSTRSAERTVVQAEIDLDRRHALATMRRLGSGDLSPLLEGDNGIVSIKGALHEELQRRSTLQFTLSSPRGALRRMSRAEVRAAIDRKLRLDAEGVIHFDLHAAGSIEATRDRWGETVETLFEMAITGRSSLEGEVADLSLRTLRWNLKVDDTRMSLREWRDVLGYVESLGVRPRQGWEALDDIPADAAGELGNVRIGLEFQIEPSVLAERLRGPFFEHELRDAMRHSFLVGQSLRRSRQLMDVAWAYWTRDSLAQAGKARSPRVPMFRSSIPLRIAPVRPGPSQGMRAPSHVDLGSAQRALLDRICRVEDDVIARLFDLWALARTGTTTDRLLPSVLAFVAALRGFDAADSAPESIFYVLDSMFPPAQRRTPYLVVTSELDGSRWRKRLALEYVAS